MTNEYILVVMYQYLDEPGQIFSAHRTAEGAKEAERNCWNQLLADERILYENRSDSEWRVWLEPTFLVD